MEAIRALMVAKRTARSGRAQTINQARALILTGPDDIRTRFTRHGPVGGRMAQGLDEAAFRRRLRTCSTTLAPRDRPGRPVEMHVPMSAR